jgi:hypothetical protein
VAGEFDGAFLRNLYRPFHGPRSDKFDGNVFQILVLDLNLNGREIDVIIGKPRSLFYPELVGSGRNTGDFERSVGAYRPAFTNDTGR